MGEMHKINIIPNTSLWMKLGRTKYNIPKAISELVDNSIDNRINNNVVVDIFFSIEGDYIGILDNASGMDVDTLTRALTIAEHIDNDGIIGEHGFGLESASSYLGENLTIYTKMETSDEYLKFNYNQEEFLQKNEWTVDYEYITKEHLLQETGLSFERGTYILIEKLNVRLYNGLISSKKDELDGTMITKFQSIYKKFIGKDILELNVHITRKNGDIEHICVPPPPIQKLAFKVNFDFLIDNNGKELKISGWAGVLDFFNENVKNKKRYTSGFDVISKNKVILQHVHLGYSYHPEKRLVLGEVELDNFRSTSDKTDFIRNSDWQALELTLNNYIIKHALHIASTAYLNNLYSKVMNNEDFDLNEDFKRSLERNSLSVEELNLFNEELLPAKIIKSEITIEEGVFENSKEEIIEYMISKNPLLDRRVSNVQENVTTESNQNNTQEVNGETIPVNTVSDISSVNESIHRELLSDDFRIPSVEEVSRVDSNTNSSIENETSNRESSITTEEGRNPTDSYSGSVAGEESNSASEYRGFDVEYNKTFTHNNMVVKHIEEETDIPVEYKFDFDTKKGILTVVSNKKMLNRLYSSLDSFYIHNIINSMVDSALMLISEEEVLDTETITRVRANVLKSFDNKFDVFTKIV